MEYKRICPKCEKEIQYKNYSAWYTCNTSATNVSKIKKNYYV